MQKYLQTKEYTTIIQERGQITLPADIRRISGLKVKDKIRINFTENKITILPVKRSISSHFGKLGKLPKGVTLNEAIKLSKEERSKKTIL